MVVEAHLLLFFPVEAPSVTMAKVVVNHRKVALACDAAALLVAVAAHAEHGVEDSGSLLEKEGAQARE